MKIKVEIWTVERSGLQIPNSWGIYLLRIQTDIGWMYKRVVKY